MKKNKWKERISGIPACSSCEIAACCLILEILGQNDHGNRFLVSLFIHLFCLRENLNSLLVKYLN